MQAHEDIQEEEVKALLREKANQFHESMGSISFGVQKVLLKAESHMPKEKVEPQVSHEENKVS